MAGESFRRLWGYSRKLKRFQDLSDKSLWLVFFQASSLEILLPFFALMQKRTKKDQGKKMLLPKGHPTLAFFPSHRAKPLKVSFNYFSMASAWMCTNGAPACGRQGPLEACAVARRPAEGQRSCCPFFCYFSLGTQRKVRYSTWGFN